MTLSIQGLKRDIVILSVQDPVLMILGMTYWYEVNLRSTMMSCDPLDTRSGLTFNFSAMMISDLLGTRSYSHDFRYDLLGYEVNLRSAMMIRDSLDTRSGLTFSLSAVMIRDPLDTRSDLSFSFSAVMIRNSLVLKKVKLMTLFCFLLSFKFQSFFFYHGQNQLFLSLLVFYFINVEISIFKVIK